MLWVLGLAYLIGSVPNSFLLTRMFDGRDIRYIGSRNAGATNVTLHVGWLPGGSPFWGYGKGLSGRFDRKFSSVP